MLYKIENTFTSQPTMYIIHTHFNNLVLAHSRVELEAAIVLYCSGRATKNSNIRAVISNLENTYGPYALMESASLMGLCTLDKVSGL